jgi:hypothetical protein
VVRLAQLLQAVLDPADAFGGVHAGIWKTNWVGSRPESEYGRLLLATWL